MAQIVFVRKVFCRVQDKKQGFILEKQIFDLRMTLKVVFKIKYKVTIRLPAMTPATIIRVTFPEDDTIL